MDGRRRQGVREARQLRRRTSTAASSPSDDVQLNGKLTLGENTADNGGARIAYMALEDARETKAKPPRRSTAIPRSSVSFLASRRCGARIAAEDTRACGA